MKKLYSKGVKQLSKILKNRNEELQTKLIEGVKSRVVKMTQKNTSSCPLTKPKTKKLTVKIAVFSQYSPGSTFYLKM